MHNRARGMSTSTKAHRWGPQAVDRAPGHPLWAQVQADLQRRLDTGEFTDTFPGEHALVEQYEVSRHTVRRALGEVRASGVVVAARGRASRVSGQQEIEQPLGALYSLFASVEASGKAQRSIVRRLDIRADGVIAVRLNLEESTPFLYLERLRLADEEPLALDRAWLPASVATALLDADFSRTGLYDELHSRCGVRLTGGSEHLRAVVPTVAERTLLDLNEGVAAFAIDRIGFVGARPIEWRHTLIRADRFTVTAQFAAHTGYTLDVGGDTQKVSAAGTRAPARPHPAIAPGS